MMAGVGRSFGRGRGRGQAALSAAKPVGQTSDPWQSSNGGDMWGSTNGGGTSNGASNDGWGNEDAGASNDGWGNNSGNNGGDTGGWGNDSGFGLGSKRGGGGGGRPCHKCGEEGHFARECPQGGGGGGGRPCHKCGEEGHFARECPQGGGGGSTCRKCGEEGHFARECPQGGGGGGRTCHKCGEEGHIARECPQGGGDGGGGSRGGCRKCGEEGHFARECPQGGGGDGDNTCRKCGEEGHFARDCPQAEAGDAKPRSTHTFEEITDEDEMFSKRIQTGINFGNYDKIPVEVTGEQPIAAPIETFEQAGLTETVFNNVTVRMKYTRPTPVQKYAIPIINSGRDVMGCAQTGSGKTAAFVLPILRGVFQNSLKSQNDEGVPTPQAVIISPVRELSKQIYEETKKFAWGTIIRPCVAYGGTAMSFQLSMINKGCNLLIATPGRLTDIINKGVVSLESVEYLVLDEADRMLDMGFSADIEGVVQKLPPKTQRQTLMFSATFPAEIQRMAAKYLNNYVFIAVGQVGLANSDVTQTVLEVDGSEKREKLTEILNQSPKDERVLVFVEMKRHADFLASYLSQSQFPTTSIHGDRLQNEREMALKDFISGTSWILVATSVAARGLDIPGVKHVINYDLPKEIDEYVHRIGRTGRIGNAGKATSFFNREKDEALARPLLKILASANQEIPDFLESAGMSGTGYGFNTDMGGVDQREEPNWGDNSNMAGAPGAEEVW